MRYRRCVPYVKGYQVLAQHKQTHFKPFHQSQAYYKHTRKEPARKEHNSKMLQILDKTNYNNYW